MFSLEGWREYYLHLNSLKWTLDRERRILSFPACIIFSGRWRHLSTAAGQGYLFYLILFYLVLSYSYYILFLSILFYFILFYLILFYLILFILFYSILFYSILFLFTLFYLILFHLIIFYLIFYSFIYDILFIYLRQQVRNIYFILFFIHIYIYLHIFWGMNWGCVFTQYREKGDAVNFHMYMIKKEPSLLFLFFFTLLNVLKRFHAFARL